MKNSLTLAVLATSLIALFLSDGIRAQEVGDNDLYSKFTIYLENLANSQLDQRQQKIEKINAVEAAIKRQAEVKQTILELIGGLPDRTPLKAQVVGVIVRDGYRIEKVIYESQTNFHVTANLYLPTTGSPPFPCVLSPCGHSHNGKASKTYQSVYISLAKKGFVVLAYDPIGQGERYQYFHPWLNRSLVGKSTSEHNIGAIQALPMGWNIARFRIWDGIRSLDYLISRPEVDESRIGVTGNSGGGTLTAYLTALDDRIKVSVPSCYTTSWRQLFTNPGPQDGEQNFVFSIESELDHADFIEAFAPKPLQICAAVHDFFPIAGTRFTFNESLGFYRIFDAEEKISLFEADDTHGFSLPRREATYRWLRKWLQGQRSDDGEPLHTHVTDWDLLCTKTGQVITEFDDEETVATIMARELVSLKYDYSIPGSQKDFQDFIEKMKRVVKQRIRLDEEIGTPKVLNRITNSEIDNITLETEPGIAVPITIFSPETKKNELILYFNDSGREAEFKEDGDINELLHSGATVCSIDPRGIGELAPPRRNSSVQDFVGSHWRIGMQSLLVGKTLVGMQVHDILSVINFLCQEPRFENSKIKCIARGFIGVAALHAASLDNRIEALILENSLVSYNAVARNPISQGVFMTIVPGALIDYDLPVLAAMTAPRSLTLNETFDQMMNLMNPLLVKSEYHFSSSVYEYFFKSANLIIK